MVDIDPKRSRYCKKDSDATRSTQVLARTVRMATDDAKASRYLARAARYRADPADARCSGVESLGCDGSAEQCLLVWGGEYYEVAADPGEQGWDAVADAAKRQLPHSD